MEFDVSHHLSHTFMYLTVSLVMTVGYPQCCREQTPSPLCWWISTGMSVLTFLGEEPLYKGHLHILSHPHTGLQPREQRYGGPFSCTSHHWQGQQRMNWRDIYSSITSSCPRKNCLPMCRFSFRFFSKVS